MYKGNDEEPIKQIFSLFSEPAKRLIRLLVNPNIRESNLNDGSMFYSLWDLFFAISFSLVLVRTANEAMLQAFYSFDDSLINSAIFIILSCANAFVISLIFYFFVRLFLYLIKDRSNHFFVLPYAIRASAIVSIPLTFLAMLLLNRVVMGHTLFQPLNEQENNIALGIALLILLLQFRLYILPLARYIKETCQRPIVSFFSALIIFVLSLVVNPSYGLGYFDNMVNKREFCAELVSRKFEGKIVSGEVNKDCLIGQCLAQVELGL